MSAMSRNSASPKPRVVPAGEPTRIPLVLHRRQRIERNAVLVAGDPGMLEAFVGILAGQAERAQVDQRQMGVGAAGDEVGAALLQAARRGSGRWRSPPWHRP